MVAVAQPVELLVVVQAVAGSSPVSHPIPPVNALGDFRLFTILSPQKFF